MTISAAGNRGGSWLTGETGPGSIFTPERLTDEHRLIRRTADDLVDTEVTPVLDRLESRDWKLARSLIVRCGELGLLGVDVPETLGGVELDKISSLIVGESVGRCPSFATTFGAQTGLAITPLICFGSDEQKQGYVPRLVSGELIGAYALSEAGSGSDALSARARAVRQPDGTFLLSGEKMWITNGGFADLFIVFAKVTGGPDDAAGQFTAFIVERSFPGVLSGKEEHKMGLHGSSTTPLVLENVRVPASAVLGEIGRGHKVAFNVLNYGRFKLGAMCSGGARKVIGQAAKYAAERRQFGGPIARFGAIRHKLAEMVLREYAVEAMLYRTAGLLDRMAADSGTGTGVLGALEELAVEASIVKVAGSEMIDFVVDENVQIHGGNGFVSDYPAEGQYRDARVNRIFEGTNEINRLLISGMLARRAAGGTLTAPVEPESLFDQETPAPPTRSGAALDGAGRQIAGIRKTARLVLGTAMKTCGTRLTEEQEILMSTADIVIDLYAAESAWLRAMATGTALHEAAARVIVHDAAGRVGLAARDALAAMTGGDVLIEPVERLLSRDPLNTVALRRQVADALLERAVYPF